MSHELNILYTVPDASYCDTVTYILTNCVSVAPEGQRQGC